MTDTDKRIRALSAESKHVARLSFDDVLAAKPPAIAKADLRAQAEAAVAGFKGAITKVPAVDRETIARPHWKDRRP